MADEKQSSGDAVDSGKMVAVEEQSSEDTVDSLKLPKFWKKKKISPESAEPDSGSGSNEPVKVQTEEDPYRYRTDFPRVGLCLIINNKTFHPYTGMGTRDGTEKDGAAVKKTFEDLGYKVIEHKDLTKEDMKDQLKKVSKMDHSKNASFVCVILSHGDEGEIYGTDGPVKFYLLTRYFKGDKCQDLLGKPKLFFIQSSSAHVCSSVYSILKTLLDEGADAVDIAPASSTTHRIPVEADFLYAYATAPGFYAWRDLVDGSWFIQSLCEILPKHRDLELMQIMIRVNKRVAYNYESSHHTRELNQKKEIPCIVSMLTKEFYFPKQV